MNNQNYLFYQSALRQLALQFYRRTQDDDPDTDVGDSDGNSNTDTNDDSDDLSQPDIDRIVAERTSRYRRRVDDLNQKLETQEKELAAFKEAEEAARQKELEEQGKYAELLDETNKKHADEKAKLLAESQRYQSQYQNLLIDNALDVAIQGIDGVNPRMIRFIKQDLKSGTLLENDVLVQIVGDTDDNGAYEPVVVGKDGQRLTNGQGAFMSVAESVQRVVDAYPEFVLAASRGGAGSGESRSTPGAHHQATLERLEQKARATGRNDDILAYQKAKREAEQRR